MPETFDYLSEEWMNAVIDLVTKKLTAEEMKHVSSSMVNIVENCPDGKRHCRSQICREFISIMNA
ncbi:MAG: hypothetical protein ACFFFO_04820 [Candidatus Thorarchaeota archaeon]